MTGREGFELAKRRIVDGIDSRLELLQKIESSSEHTQISDWAMKLSLRSQIQELEKVRDFVRNTLLWKSEDNS